MTTERKKRIDELVIKLKHCKAECDEMYNEEDGQQYDFLKNRHQIAADLCSLNMKKINIAESNITEAIEKLEVIVG